MAGRPEPRGGRTRRRATWLVALILSLAAGVAAQPAPEPRSAFFTNGADLVPEQAAGLGAKTTRLDFNWYRVQKFPESAIDFSYFDNKVRNLDGVDVEVIGTLSSKGPLELDVTPEVDRCAFEFRCLKLSQQGVPAPECDGYVPDQERMYRPRDMEAWRAFVKATVERYDGDGVDDMPGLVHPIRLWQLGDEYPRSWCSDESLQGQDFVDLMSSTWAYVREAFGDTRFVTPGIATDRGLTLSLADGYLGEGPIWIRGKLNTRDDILSWTGLPELREQVETLLRSGEFDVGDIHLYGYYELIPDRLSWFRDNLAQNPRFWAGLPPVWVLEGGGPFAPTGEVYRQPDDPPTVANPEVLRENASYVPKYYLTGLTAGVPMLGWHLPSEYDTFGSDFGDVDLLDYDELPRPSYHAYRFLTGLLGQGTSAVRLPDRNGATLYQITAAGTDGADRLTFVAWSDAAPATVDLSAEAAGAELSFYRLPVASGETEPVALIADPAAVSVDRVPVFMEATYRPAASIEPSSHDFELVTVGEVSGARTFTIRNEGRANLVLGTASVDPSTGEFVLQADACSGAAVPPGGTCTFQAVFAPATPGVKQATVTISTNDSAHAVLEVALSGSGLAPPQVLELSCTTELSPGNIARFQVTGAGPFEVVTLLASRSGGSGPCVPQLGGLCLDLGAPLRRLATTPADGEGEAVLSWRVPFSLPPGTELYFQAVIQRGPGGADSLKSNEVTATVR